VSLKESLRIMVVDDMSVSRALINQSLEEMGIKNIRVEADPKKALATLVAGAPVHLVVSDMNMPGMSGLDLLQSLRENKTTQRIGFIIITATPSQEILTRGQQLAVNNLVRKPFTTPTLKAAIEQVVGRLG
jgi:two-component system chemotaxis response regulator CheY